MSTEAIYEELTTLRQRTEQLEKAFSSATRAVKQQYRLWIDSQRAGETVTELRHRLSFMIQRHPLGVISWNLAFEVTDWNPAAEKIFGYSEREVLGRHAADIIVAEGDKQEINAAFTQFTQQKQVIPNTSQNYTKDGKKITCKWYHTPLTDLHGKLIGLLSIVENITVAPVTEVTTMASVTDDQQLIANLPAMVYQFQLEPDNSASFVKILSGSQEIYGIKPEVGQQNCKLFTEAVHPCDRQSFLESIAISAQTLQTWRWEGRILSSCGQWKWVQGLSQPEVQSTGKILWDGLLIDITNRKTAFTETPAITFPAQTEAMFRSLVENLDDIIYTLSLDGKFTYLSPSFTEMFGYEISEFIDKSFASIINPEDITSYETILQKILAIGKKQAGIEVRVKRADDSDCWIVFNASPIKNTASKVVGFQGNMRDITERKITEADLVRSQTQLQQQTSELQQTLQECQRIQSQLIQSEKMSSIGQLVAGVAHEINNPVNFIYGNLAHANNYTHDLLNFLKLYQKHYPNPPAEITEEAEAIDLDFLLQDLPHLLSSMKVGADRIRKIVASLRTFSRFDEADLKFADIHEGIDSTLTILDYRLKAKPNRPTIQVIKEYGDLPLIQCYAGQLNQVFMNILANAIDALEESYELQKLACDCLTIRIYTEKINAQHITIRIADNGPGITEQVINRLFDPFYTTKPVGKGTGMGLSISYQIITERHNGSIKCISSPGQGAEFVIEIPIEQSIVNGQ
ncbi:PAS domain S-box protein [Calothrix sp. FACHB-1219]|uniref:PAS domain S-box protein n=1 Tax=unclassified Calothrix TaxID=2619626 RepID=UPI001689A787|nr:MULTISPECIES: PAS domain S-box protein [unclassified Calothrix]MBD2201265.1 PAS domain S-box protein [Calothrix sp. FACHB-168]MBD2215699.1 PAS domain S-box protein [Calothrix sp. FACHB-1219]